MSETKQGQVRILWRYPNQWELDEYGSGIEPSDRILVGMRPVCQEDFPGEAHPELPDRRTLFATMPYKDYLLPPEWEKLRVAALRRADYRCQLCNARGELHVHHRTYGPFGEEEPADLTVLCRPCHYDHHERQKLKSLSRNLN